MVPHGGPVPPRWAPYPARARNPLTCSSLYVGRHAERVGHAPCNGCSPGSIRQIAVTIVTIVSSSGTQDGRLAHRCQTAAAEPHEAAPVVGAPRVRHRSEYGPRPPPRPIPRPSLTAPDTGRNIFESLRDFKPYKDATRISIYLSMPAAEVQTDAIVRDALAAGKQVFVPYLHKSPLETPDTPARVMDMVHLRSVQDYESLTLDRWGIPSIDPATVHERQRILGGPDAQRSDAATLDLMLMPGVAFDFDEAGSVRRLGHGKGFYDFFLNRYLAKQGSSTERPPLRLYGLALTEQLLASGSGEEVPTGAHDRRLHGLVLGSGEIRQSSTSSV